jgi:hypothetical protein
MLQCFLYKALHTFAVLLLNLGTRISKQRLDRLVVLTDAANGLRQKLLEFGIVGFSRERS